MQQHAQAAERPYRSHLRPACVACRRRKSRCQTEANSDACVTCRAHRTECFFPASPRSRASPDKSRRGRPQPRTAARTAPQPAANTPEPEPRARLTAASGSFRLDHRAASPDDGVSSTSRPPRQAVGVQDEESPLALGSSDDHHVNLHIVGPAVTNDSQVLSDYLSGIPEAMRGTCMVIPESAGRSRPVLFTMVQKRPLGVTVNRSPSAEKLEVIEKLLEPCTAAVIDE